MAMGEIHQLPKKWLPIATAPADSDLEVCVIDKQGVHALLFPCRRNAAGWIDPATPRLIDIQPTHWRLWTEEQQTD